MDTSGINKVVVVEFFYDTIEIRIEPLVSSSCITSRFRPLRLVAEEKAYNPSQIRIQRYTFGRKMNQSVSTQGRSHCRARILKAIIFKQ